MITQLISDTHSLHEQVSINPNARLLVHAGDSTDAKDSTTNQVEFDSFIEWYASQSTPYKILIAGNHDWWATKLFNREKCKELGIIYLEDSFINIEGKLIFGSP